MNCIRLVTFDVMGTLLRFRIRPSLQYTEVAHQFGINVEEKKVGEYFKKHWKQMNSEHPNYGKNSGLGWRKWWTDLVNQTFRDSAHPAQIDSVTLAKTADHLIVNYSTAAYYHLMPGATDILSFLHQQNIPIGIISNHDERLPCILEEMCLTKYIKFVLTSYDAGVSKPHPQIFHTAIQKMDCEDLNPATVLHIGDNPEFDYLGAVKSGWNAALVHQDNPEEVLKQYPDILSCMIFNELKDLKDYISSVLEKSGQLRDECTTN